MPDQFLCAFDTCVYMAYIIHFAAVLQSPLVEKEVCSCVCSEYPCPIVVLNLQHACPARHAGNLRKLFRSTVGALGLCGQVSCWPSQDVSGLDTAATRY